MLQGDALAIHAANGMPSSVMKSDELGLAYEPASLRYERFINRAPAKHCNLTVSFDLESFDVPAMEFELSRNLSAPNM
jgi:hypothetical protein